MKIKGGERMSHENYKIIFMYANEFSERFNGPVLGQSCPHSVASEPKCGYNLLKYFPGYMLSSVAVFSPVFESRRPIMT